MVENVNAGIRDSRSAVTGYLESLSRTVAFNTAYGGFVIKNVNH